MIIKIKNKKGYLTRDFVIAGIFLMGVIALMILMVQGVADNYNRGDLVDEGFSEKYDQLENITGDVTIMLDRTRSGEGLSFLGTFNIAFRAAFTAIQLVFGILGLLGSVLGNLIVDFKLEEKPVAILLIVVTSAVAVRLIYVWLSSISRGRI